MSDAADERTNGEGRRPGEALYFYGVARVRTWRTGKVDDDAVTRVRYRDLEALVRPTTWELPPADAERLRQHHEVLEAALRRGTVLPAPFGIVFRGRRQLIRMLEEQYLALDEGLSFLEGHYEVRVHLSAKAGAEAAPALEDLAMEMYSELRRHARAAVPIPGENGRVLSAAFLVERTSWVEFVERAEDLDAAHAELSFDITGPWPPYDFVQFS